MKRCLLIVLAAVSVAALEGRESFGDQVSPASDTGPWFTGPILTPSGHVIPDGHQNYEPYVYWTQTTGKYNKNWKSSSSKTFNNVLAQFTMQFGVAPSIEFDMAPQFNYNETQGEHMWRVSDLPITLAFQILKEKPGQWYPATKLRLGATVPLGKYDHLNPSKLGADVGGNGAWEPQLGLVFTNLYHVVGEQYFAWRLFVNYSFPAKVSVKGLSVYGGEATRPGIPGTRGTIRPGSSFLILYGAEYSLTKNWVLALDIQYQHQNRLHFSGRSPGNTAPKGPSKELFALAPGIEYNWNNNIGIIVGPWFSVAGRNTERFISYVIAINIYN